MSTLTDKLPKLPTVKLPEALVLDEAKKPVFAAVGVVDLCVEQVKDQVVEQVKDFPADAKKAATATSAKVQAKIEAARTARTAQFKSVPAQLKALPAQAKEFRTELEGRVAKAQTKATAYYGQLAVRGEKLVTQIRRQPATEAAIAEGKAAVKKAEASATSAKKATKAAEKAVEGAAAKLG